MTAQLATTEDTPARWERVIDDLTDKTTAFENETKRLKLERASLVLDAGMGDSAATKRLKTLDDRLVSIARETAVTSEAIEKARGRLDNARAAVRADEETKRQRELGQLAQTAYQQAQSFTSALQQVVANGAALKLTVRNMLQRATREERAVLQRLLEHGPYMRAAEAAGLRAHFEFAAYPGPPEHLKTLEHQFHAHLGPWLVEEKEVA